MAGDAESQDVDERLDALRERAGEFLDKTWHRSAYRLYGEIKRLAKSEQRAIPYLQAVFHEMDLAQTMLEPKITCERAIELITLLENEEQARRIQPDLPRQEYEGEVAWMTACAYENLAEGTGMTQGYNSAGLHQCIADGIQVCKRTGKLGCINCFREYAAQVYTASEDLEMALHHARSIAANEGPWPQRGDRRYLGHRNEAWVQLLKGHVEVAEACLQRSLPLCDEPRVGLPDQARRNTLAALEAVLLLAGKHDPSRPLVPPLGEQPGMMGFNRLPPGENVEQDLRWAHNDALRACCRQDFDEAIKLLSNWDRKLTDNSCVHEWFETRLRLIAAHRLAGQEKRIDTLAKPLALRAQKAEDFLTLRRLGRLLDSSESATPLALLGPVTCGVFQGAAARVSVAVPAGMPTDQPAPQVAEPTPEKTPLDDDFERLTKRLDEAGDDETALAAILQEILALPPDAFTHPLDAIRFVHFVRFLIRDAALVEPLWHWAEAVGGRFPQQPSLLSLRAVLGEMLHGAPDGVGERVVPLERVEKLFRESLDLEPDDPGNFARAGAFFLARENFGEAERCLARGFRLARQSGFLALRLAEVYRRTDRQRDALAVLDMCLREGCAEAEVAWEAALGAFTLGQFDALLTYMDQFEARNPGQEWAQYYRAIALLELGRLDESLQAVAEEEIRSKGTHPLPLLVMRTCIAAGKEQFDLARELLEEVLAMRLVEVDYLTFLGLCNLFQRLWRSVAFLGEQDSLRTRLETLLLQTGLAPDEMFEVQRQRGEESPQVNFYRCLVEQMLDESWPRSPGCLHDQQAWVGYVQLWGVLAHNEEEAIRLVLDWQNQCCPSPAQVLETTLEEQGFKDKVGVVWQGPRSGAEPPDGEAGADMETP